MKNDAPTDTPRLVTPTVLEGRYLFRFGRWSLIVDPVVGGRVESFAIDGRDILSGPGVNEENWGSTFWPSPQAAWGWPPPPQIDRWPYTADLTGTTLTLRSDSYAPLGLVVVKRFSADATTGLVTIEYTMRNEGKKSLSLAPWEISRVPADGVTFYPVGTAPGRAAGPWAVERPFDKVTQTGTVAWYAYEPGQPEQKWIADGAEGWLAYAAGDVVLIKMFDEVPAAEQPAEEGEIELYLSPAKDGGRYIEVENQGALRTFGPGETYSWTVKWLLVPLPRSGMVVAGNQALVDFVRSAVTAIRR